MKTFFRGLFSIGILLVLISVTALSADSMLDDELTADVIGKWERTVGGRGFATIYLMKEGILFQESSDFINSFKYKIEDGILVWFDTNMSDDWVYWEITSIGYDNLDQFTLELEIKFPWESDEEAEIVSYRRVKEIY